MPTRCYAAGEEEISDATSAKLCALRTQGCARRVVETLKESLLDEAREGDYILFLGAGSITQWAQEFAQEAEQKARRATRSAS